MSWVPSVLQPGRKSAKSSAVRRAHEVAVPSKCMSGVPRSVPVERHADAGVVGELFAELGRHDLDAVAQERPDALAYRRAHGYEAELLAGRCRDRAEHEALGSQREDQR